MKSTIKFAVAALIFSLSTTNAGFVPEELTEVTDATDEEFLARKSRPVVGASANIVTINDQLVPGEYFGPLNMGNKYKPLHVSYNTMIHQIVVYKNPSYEPDTSEEGSARPIIDGANNTEIERVNIGNHQIKGPIYNESMCLIGTDKLNSRLCVKDMPFVYASTVSDEKENSVQGVLGLARGSPGERTYVSQLKEQGIINDAIVGINFEDPAVDGQRSQVSFGEIVFSEVQGGKAGMNYYSVLGRDQWGLGVDDFMYDGKDMTNGQGRKTATIDSSAVGIMLPHFVWEQVLVTMKYSALFDTKRQYYINTVKLENGMEEMQIPDHTCDEIIMDLKPISFMLENTLITINPKGYTYMSNPDQNYCQIGLHPIASPNEYRLGNIFLRNFYTALDFDKDLIMIGVNKGSAKAAFASIQGKSEDPFKPRDPIKQINVGIIYLGLFILCLIAIIYVCVEKRRLKKVAQQEKEKNSVNSQTQPKLQEDKKEASESSQLIQKSKTNDKYNIQNESVDNEDSLDRSGDTGDKEEF